MKFLLALAALALLGGCNVLVTEKPLLAAADEAGAPVLRPGVWLVFEQPGCDADLKAPVDEWPDCAGGGVVHPGEIVAHDQKAAKGVWEHAPFVLAAGDPRVAQLQIDEEVEVSAGDQVAQQSARPYGYAGVRPTKLDDQGRIVALSYWPVLCGPPPPKNKAGEDVAGGTMKPMPGLKMKPGDPTCTTASPEVLSRAAKASEAWNGKVADARWLRDGER